MSRPSALFLSQMSDTDLLNYCENNFDELVTSTTEEALIIKLREYVDGEGGSMPMTEVKGLLADIDAQIPGEDFLADIIQELYTLANSKVNKADLIDGINNIANALEAKQQDYAGGFEFASSMINDVLNPKTRR